jgi:putative ABC transport system permease protein
MTFSQLARTNVLRNKRKYAAYFVSSAFVIMVYFVYSFFSFHPALAESEIGEYTTLGMRFAQSIIYIFSFFFVLYSMGAFLKARKKEFGILRMIGASHTQLRWLIFLENIIIGVFASIGGIIIGILLAGIVLVAGSSFISMKEPLSFYFPITAIWTTFGSFMILFFIISLYKVITIKNSSLIDLLKGTRKPKPEPKASVIKTISAVLCLGIGYTVALVVKGVGVILAMIPVTIIVSIGTYLVFTQLSVYVITKLKNKQHIFWKGTTLISLSDLAYRMRDNARMFFFVAMVSTVAFSAIGTLVGLASASYKELDKGVPFDLKYVSNEEKEHLPLIEQTLEDKGISYDTLSVTYYIDVNQETSRTTAVMSASEYKKFVAFSGEEGVVLTGNEAVFVTHEDRMWQKQQIDEWKLMNGQETFVIQETVVGTKAASLFPSKGMVVSDEAYNRLSKQNNEIVTLYNVEQKGELQEIGETLTNVIGEKNFEAREYILANAKQGGGIILFVGFFIGVVFFVAAGSFLYFRLYADVEDDRRQVNNLLKIGLVREELSTVITTRLALLFFVPIIVATIHGAVSLTAMQHIFDYNLWKERLLVLSSFVAFQCIYFFFVRKSYVKHVID